MAFTRTNRATLISKKEKTTISTKLRLASPVTFRLLTKLGSKSSSFKVAIEVRQRKADKTSCNWRPLLLLPSSPRLTPQPQRRHGKRRTQRIDPIPHNDDDDEEEEEEAAPPLLLESMIESITSAVSDRYDLEIKTPGTKSLLEVSRATRARAPNAMKKASM